MATLLERELAGYRLKFVLFWGHEGPVDQAGSHWLSQWFPARFEVHGQVYPTAEHYMMAAKAQMFGDASALAAVLAARTPGEAKALGRSVKGFDSGAWDAVRFDVVVRASLAKFGQHRAMRDYLIGTGDRVLVEASPVDRIWGVGLAADDLRATQVAEWVGQNLLGFALMEARDRLLTGSV